MKTLMSHVGGGRTAREITMDAANFGVLKGMIEHGAS